MINKKLISFDRGAMRFVGANVAFQWLGMLCNIIFVRVIAQLVGAVFAGGLTHEMLRQDFVLCLFTIPLRYVFTLLASSMSDCASKDVKRTLRSSIYAKLTRLGAGYSETVATSDAVMLASEGVEQIDTYFAKYLPQLFYSLLAPVTLFVLLVGVHARSAILLLCCVPLIPLSIVAVQKFAKKLLANYWGEYTTLGDSFLENIQGLTTLKIYQADGWKHEEMNRQAERFRKITMKVLTMQLNSVTLMDLMAPGGGADHPSAGGRFLPAAPLAGQLLPHRDERSSLGGEDLPSAGGGRACRRHTGSRGGYHPEAGPCDLWLRERPHHPPRCLAVHPAGQLRLSGGRVRLRQKHHCGHSIRCPHRVYGQRDAGRCAGADAPGREPPAHLDGRAAQCGHLQGNGRFQPADGSARCR